jgi:hypothetical protein
MNKDDKKFLRGYRFKKVATKRVDLILKTLNLLSNCSNRNSYDYDEQDVKKMFTVIKEQLRITESNYLDQLNKIKKKEFKF